MRGVLTVQRKLLSGIEINGAVMMKRKNVSRNTVWETLIYTAESLRAVHNGYFGKSKKVLVRIRLFFFSVNFHSSDFFQNIHLVCLSFKTVTKWYNIAYL